MESIRVADYMDPRPVTFREDESLYEALVALAHSRTGGGPVIDQQHRVVGFLSEQDCLREGLEACYLCEPLATVADMMQREVLTVSADDSIVELAQTMMGPKPRTYPVVDAEGKLLGLISRHHVLQAMVTTMASCFAHHPPR